MKILQFTSPLVRCGQLLPSSLACTNPFENVRTHLAEEDRM